MIKYVFSVSSLFIFLSWLFSIFFFAIFKDAPFIKDYKIMRILKSERINRAIGASLCSYIIANTFFKYLNPLVYMKNTSSIEMQRVKKEIENAEKGHILAFLLVIVCSHIYLWFTNNWIIYTLANFLNIFFNLYPVLALQLQNQRINKLMLWKLEANFEV